ncbi:hypothetical protein T4D_2811 [Trichinella pseudospiralis]|uniref:Uncharacterized protein n=1 Tax=Trichinella pseudospiralis TaxID=6337 RepID=A0A0V1FA78_TRIPS|nr:hypothetical protein T4D_2811 [Trichinella pseudospiralis]
MAPTTCGLSVIGTNKVPRYIVDILPLPIQLLSILIRSLRSATLRLRGVVIQPIPYVTDTLRFSALWRNLSHGDEKHRRIMLFSVNSDKRQIGDR